MKLKATVKTILKKLDRFSPYPVFYPFVMSDNEKAIFDQAIRKSSHYLEFGLGGSTLRAIQKSKAKIYTVESSPDWISHMREYVFVRYFENKRLYLFPVNIGPVGDWGYPESEDFKGYFQRYSSSVFQSIDSKLIDLALVDGRFRVACILKIVLACYENSNILILIHDFWDRPHYHVVLKYLDIVNRADTIGLFSVKKNVDLKSVEHDYEAFKLIPD
jgi:hypothetical protein